MLGETNGSIGAADLAAVLGNNGNGFGGNNAWWIILFLIFMNGGWGNGNCGGNNGSVQRGFDQTAIMSGLQNIQNGLAAAEVSQCGQTANLTGQLNNIALNQATGLCGVNSGIADLRYTVATEACNDRAAVTDALQNVLNVLNSGIQSIKDQMCQDKIDAKNEEIANLRTQINLSNLAASQSQQTAQLMADNAAQTAALIQRISPAPVPSYNVPNPYVYNGCGCNTGCGCGM